MEASAIQPVRGGLGLSLKDKLRQVRTKLVRIDVEDTQFVDAVRRIVEVLRVGAVEIPIVAKTKSIREESRLNRFLGCLQSQRDMLQLTNDRAWFSLGRHIVEMENNK